jgi:hypothetical protein
MSALSVLSDAGIKASIEPSGNLRLKGLSNLTGEQKKQIIDFAKSYKFDILTALSQGMKPGQCESCPAAGYSDLTGGGLKCFFTAYYKHKAGCPFLCAEVRRQCPRMKIQKE